MFKQKYVVLQSYRSLRALQSSSDFICKSYDFITILLCRKRKNGYPNSGYPYPTRLSGYLPGSTRSVSDPNPKLHYPGITRIRTEYKKTRIRIRKMVPNQYLYPVPVLGTLPVFIPTQDKSRGQGSAQHQYVYVRTTSYASERHTGWWT
jgi:hypothetical protein